jgi:uncharacterized membrane protein
MGIAGCDGEGYVDGKREGTELSPPVSACKISWHRDVVNPLRTDVYFCHQNQNTKNIGHFMTPLILHNIGTHLKGIETSFQVVTLFLKSFHFWVSYITFWSFLKIPSVFKGLTNVYNGKLSILGLQQNVILTLNLWVRNFFLSQFGARVLIHLCGWQTSYETVTTKSALRRAPGL